MLRLFFTQIGGHSMRVKPIVKCLKVATLSRVCLAMGTAMTMPMLSHGLEV